MLGIVWFQSVFGNSQNYRRDDVTLLATPSPKE